MRMLPLRLMARMLHKENPSALEQRICGWMLRSLPGMLSCAEFEEFVYDYYEDRLSPEARRHFEMHMQLCPKCEVHFDSYVRAVALGKRVCEDDDRLPDGMPEELVGAILLAREERQGR